MNDWMTIYIRAALRANMGRSFETSGLDHADMTLVELECNYKSCCITASHGIILNAICDRHADQPTQLKT